MCHVLLLLPVLVLPVLWLLPLSIGLPLYALALAIALWVYALAVKTMRMPATTGAERGRVVRVERGSATLQIHGELWVAEAEGEPLAAGTTIMLQPMARGEPGLYEGRIRLRTDPPYRILVHATPAGGGRTLEAQFEYRHHH